MIESPDQTAPSAPMIPSVGYSHNDYRNSRPLVDALESGCGGVEADVVLRNGQLLVAHSWFTARRNRTLQSLYLDPLREYIATQGPNVLPNGRSLLLMIDVKTNAGKTYAALHAILRTYADIVKDPLDKRVVPGLVRVVISGNRPKDVLRADPKRLVGFDGRLADIPSTSPSHLMPIVSDRWGRLFRWKGKGRIPKRESDKLLRLVTAVHAEGRQLRLWGTPERSSIWKVLVESGVDYISTDRVQALQEFLVASTVARPESKP